jgi:hypothetical protein
MRLVRLDGLHVDDANHPQGYQGLNLFCDPGGSKQVEPRFPYVRCQQVEISELTTASGLKPRVSPNAALAASVKVVPKNAVAGGEPAETAGE